MAKSRFTTGGKTRKTVNKEQTSGTAPGPIAQVSAVPSGTTAAEAVSQAKVAPEAKATPAANLTPEPKIAPEAKVAEAKAVEAKIGETETAETKVAAKSPEAAIAPETKAVPETKNTPELRKFEVVKTEPRKNVVPINRTPIHNLEEEVRRRAYEIYQQRQGAPGSEFEDWLNAEREVRKRYQQQSA